MDPQVRVVKINADRADRAQILDLVKTLAGNPIIELIGGFVLVETLQRYPEKRPIIGNLQGNLIEGGIFGLITAQQLAPLMPSITAAGQDIMKLLPALAAL